MVCRTAALAASALALGVSGARAAEPLVSELPDVVAGCVGASLACDPRHRASDTTRVVASAR